MPYPVGPLPSYLNLREGDTLPPAFFQNIYADPAPSGGGGIPNPYWTTHPISEGMTAAGLEAGVEPTWPQGYGGMVGNYGGNIPNTSTTSGKGTNPVVRNAIQNLIAQLTPTATGNAQYSQGIQVGRTQRNPNVASRVNDQYAGYDTRTRNANQTLTDFTNEYINMKPRLRGALDSESAAIGKVYGSGPGSLQSGLADARKKRSAAIRQATSSALARASRASNLARMNSGNSSYLDRLLGQEYARISAGAAGDEAEQQRADELALADRQAGLAGRRSALAGVYLDQSLAPVEASYRFGNLNQADLQNLAQADNANTIYDVTTPEDRVARQLRLLDTLSNLDQRYNDYAQ